MSTKQEEINEKLKDMLNGKTSIDMHIKQHLSMLLTYSYAYTISDNRLDGKDSVFCARDKDRRILISFEDGTLNIYDPNDPIDKFITYNSDYTILFNNICSIILETPINLPKEEEEDFGFKEL